ncbi:MAG: cobyric acid synthase [Hyphomicrobiales bacterium]|nr:cobyric acid synthase [Hyphomicrobiales bacterium]MDE2113917.1 cobyric acid synthase [Hyphomicrobiales bacterium]
MPAKALMFQGTGSDVGKSLIVAGLCRAYHRRGLRVLPFKPQNMSNNAAVTADGGEIGRAQALQARACKVPASRHMNPVLLKPQSEVGAQVVVQGRVWGNAKARDYQALKPQLMPYVLESFAHLRSGADLVLVEGAGSAAEVNLRANDIANMGFARAADVPVVLIGDIDRGGVIAQIVGTRVVLDSLDLPLVGGFIVNRFRGDPSLFADGMQWIADKSQWPALGLVPHFADAVRLPPEDAFGLGREPVAARSHGGRRVIAVPMLAHIANFDDFDPLRLEADVELVMVRPGSALPVADLIILPGSKATLADLAHLRDQKWHIDLLAHHRRGGKILGICAGFQMLGRALADPDGMESHHAHMEGLGLLDVTTTLSAHKNLREVEGRSLVEDAPFRGYEMHIGETAGPDCAHAFLQFGDGRLDGAISTDGLVRGTYVHGLFNQDAQRAALLGWIGATASQLSYDDGVDAVLDALADHLEAHVDLDRLLTLAR